MIGFNRLGRMGRLGNQMFQYASLKGIAVNNHLEFCIPFYKESIKDGGGNNVRSELFDCFELPVRVGKLDNQSVVELKEKFFHFDEQLFSSCPDNVSLRGFYQTEKYFKNIDNEIHKDFAFKPDIQSFCKKIIAGIMNPIALHVRRSDYLDKSKYHPPCPLVYYEEALAFFGDYRNVLVFSDDPEWCKEQALFSSNRFTIVQKQLSHIDLCMMSLCNDFIIANSTFSWCGAWLSSNADKKVFAPAQWFGPGHQRHDISDLIPVGWEIIAND